MKFLHYLNLFGLTFYSIRAKVAHRETDYFIPLISKSREFYSSAFVIFVHPADSYGGYGDLHSTHIVHTWTRILGRERIMTLNVNPRSLYKVEKNIPGTTKPLIVVFIPHLEALFEFSNATKTIKMSPNKWLVIFLQTQSNKEHNYCHKPVGNPFNLAFDTEMLVFCHDDDMLREWYSVDTHTTEIFDLATYDPHRGIVLRTDLSLYNRRNDMKGTILRVIAMEDSVQFVDKNWMFKGLFGQVFNELVETLNFTIKIVNVTTEYGSFNSTSHAWSGAIAEMASGHADIGVGGFVMTSHRHNVVDFVTPLDVSRVKLFLRKPDIFHMQWSAYFKAFSPAIWLGISMIIIISPVILILMKDYSGTVNKVRTISEEFLQIWGIFCQQGLTEFPKSSWLGMAYITLFTTAVVVSAAYSASLIRFFTTRTPFLPFLSVDELIENGSYDLIAVREGSQYDAITSTSLLFEEMGITQKYIYNMLTRKLRFNFQNSKNPGSVALMKLMKPYDLLPKDSLEAFQSICNDSKVVFYSFDQTMQSVRPFIPCELSSINTGQTVSFSFVVPKGSPYTSCLRHQLLKFKSSGLLDRLKNSNYPIQDDRDITFKAVEIFNVSTVLAMFGGGLLLSIVILILETLYYNYSFRKNSMRKNPLNTQGWRGFEFVE